MQIVVVTNMTGYQVRIGAMLIKPLRETTKEQSFSFTSCKDALAFVEAVKKTGHAGLVAAYAPSDKDLEAEGIKLVKTQDDGALKPNGELTLEQKQAQLVKELMEKSKSELEKMAEDMKLEDWKGLNKEPLAELIAANTQL
ncbi:hypothetical protein [Vibrio sonorensis]|uniref:hypothetical protein n=1 Tax=Vibrio sonorensis TaxID=1004316 RepID=UPI0008D99D12|nr:hypothetical protein [Vibrio sonorensis]